MDWLKAILIGLGCMGVLLIAPVLFALAGWLVLLAALVVGIWFIIQVLKEDNDADPDKPP